MAAATRGSLGLAVTVGVVQGRQHLRKVHALPQQRCYIPYNSNAGIQDVDCTALAMWVVRVLMFWCRGSAGGAGYGALRSSQQSPLDLVLLPLAAMVDVRGCVRGSTIAK
jgi:hypothetical protein